MEQQLQELLPQGAENELPSFGMGGGYPKEAYKEFVSCPLLRY